MIAIDSFKKGNHLTARESKQNIKELAKKQQT